MSEYSLKRRDIECFGISKPDEKPALKRISIKSVKRMAEDRLYYRNKKEYLSAHIKCEVPGCNKVSETLHHKKGRIGELIYNERYFLAVCMQHHREIEDNPGWAIEEGYSLPRLQK